MTEKGEENKEEMENIDLILKEYEIVVRTQMHFNELIIKARSLGISVVTVIYGAAAYSISAIPDVFMFSHLHPSFFIVLSGISLAAVLFLLDYFYYYKMLLGAVIKGYEFDDLNIGTPNYKFFGMNTEITNVVGDEKDKYLTSKVLVELFYGIIIAIGIVFLYVIARGFSA